MSVLKTNKQIPECEAMRLFNALLSLALRRGQLGTTEASNIIGAAVDISAVSGPVRREIQTAASQSFLKLDGNGKSFATYQLIEGLHRSIPDGLQAVLNEQRCAIVEGELLLTPLDPADVET